MNRIFIRAAFKTPYINLDYEKGLIEIKGKSIPEHAKSFYGHLVEWIKEYSQNTQATTTVNIAMEYLNTDSKKYMTEICELFGEIYKKGKKIDVNWYYETDDEGMMEVGEDYAKSAGMTFNLIGVEEFDPLN